MPPKQEIRIRLAGVDISSTRRLNGKEATKIFDRLRSISALSDPTGTKMADTLRAEGLTREAVTLLHNQLSQIHRRTKKENLAGVNLSDFNSIMMLAKAQLHPDAPQRLNPKDLDARKSTGKGKFPTRSTPPQFPLGDDRKKGGR